MNNSAYISLIAILYFNSVNSFYYIFYVDVNFVKVYK